MDTLEAEQQDLTQAPRHQVDNLPNDRTRFPRLPRAISLFVAGHRWDRLKQHPGYDLGKGPAFRSLDRVLRQFSDIREQPPDAADALFPGGLYCPGRPTIRLVTGQADGVDEYAIAEAARLGLPVDLVVPDYLQAGGERYAQRSVALGCPQGKLQTDDEPYAMRDELALSYADVLIAVWDGGGPRGTAGGVVRLIRRAVEAGLPILWIDMAGAVHTIADDLVSAFCLYELHQPDPKGELLRSLFKPWDLENGVLIESLRRRLNPLDHSLVRRNRETKMLARYASERRGPAFFEARTGFSNECMSALFRMDGHALVDSLLKLVFGADAVRVQDVLGDGHADEAPGKSEPAALDGLQERFEWSDARATCAAGKHRSGIWQLYGFSAAAVVASVWGMLFSRGESNGPIVEIALVISIMFVLWRARHNGWHRLWHGHRFVAEQIRCLRMLRPFLAIPQPFHEPLFWHVTSSHRGHQLRNAELWLLQRALGADGLPASYCGYELASADRRQLAADLHREVNGQIEFHERTYEDATRLHEVMHESATILFIAAAVSTAFRLILKGDQSHVLELISASCPALAAALHGVMTKLEIGRVAMQSSSVYARLAVLESVVVGAKESIAPADWISMERLRTDAIEVASLLSQENIRWRELISYQVAEIPA
ncbi:hypothetical protein [Paraburkholderia oxyphila]|uniref:hypothetical protein n=1 Tax=Paraburkholderia oxyphila TaxID=614212 RepID=UPI000487C1AC|nr:hypothetical protein [Paraburkholderia oxyphila]